MFSHRGCTSLHSCQQCTKISFFSSSWTALVISLFFLNNSHSKRWEVVSHYGFDFHFPEEVDREAGGLQSIGSKRVRYN